MANQTGPDPVRILFVSDERAWPPVSGYRHRTRLILSVLAAVGPVTWVVAPRNRFDGGEPIEVPQELRPRIDPILAPAATRGRAATVGRWCTSGLPWPLAAGDWSTADEALARLAGTGFDLVWAMGLDALAATGRAGVEAPVVVVDADLESLKLARQLEHGRSRSPIRSAMARLDVGRWARLERAAARELSGFSVCSEAERHRLGGSAFVTPNAYPDPAIHWPTGGPGPDGHSPEDHGPTLLFVGSMGYEPNRDGLAWFVDEVLPSIRRHHPEVTLRIVGSGPGVDAEVAATPGVEVVGPVADVGPELGRATAAVVPIHWGAGTRVKILEAMAHRVPVVSTTTGAEGLDLVDGQHLLVADDPVSFADACRRALDADPDLAGLVDRAHRRFSSHHAETVVSHELGRRVRRLLAERQEIGGPRWRNGRPRRGRRRRR